MPSTESLSSILRINTRHLTREENILLEGELFMRVYAELKNIFKERNKECYQPTKHNFTMENAMLNENFAHLIIRDIVSTDEYTLEGIAHYAATHEDVLIEIISGRNCNPSAAVLAGLINLHQTVRKELYHAIRAKIASALLLDIS